MELSFLGSTIMIIIVLCVIVLLFYMFKYRRIKKSRVETEAFLQNVLKSVDNIINYYEPVYDVSDKISDFKIVYANECNKEYLDLIPEEIIGKNISEVFPFLFLNGEFEGLVKCFTEKENVILHRQIKIADKRMWFKSIVKPLDAGITVTARNITPEQDAEERLVSLNEELKHRNQELSYTEAFLKTIIKSTNAIIIHLEPSQDRAGTITDFEIVFTTDAAEKLTGQIPTKSLGRNLSEIYPVFMNNGIFAILVISMQKKTTEEMTVQLGSLWNGPQSFIVNAASTGTGVTLNLTALSPAIES